MCPVFIFRMVLVPNNLALLVDQNHDVDECITGEYNHKTNDAYFFYGKVRIPCHPLLTSVYPFVSRHVRNDGQVEEKLNIGNRTLHVFEFS